MSAKKIESTPVSNSESRFEKRFERHDGRDVYEFVEKEKKHLFRIFDDFDAFTFGDIKDHVGRGIVEVDNLGEIVTVKKNLDVMMREGRIPADLIEKVSEKKADRQMAKQNAQRRIENNPFSGQTLEVFAHLRATQTALSEEEALQHTEYIDDVSLYWNTRMELFLKFAKEKPSIQKLDEFPAFFRARVASAMAIRATSDIKAPTLFDKKDTLDHTYFDALLATIPELDETVSALIFDEFARGLLASLRKNMSGNVSENKYSEAIAQITTVIDAIPFAHLRDRLQAEVVLHKVDHKKHIDASGVGPYTTSVIESVKARNIVKKDPKKALEVLQQIENPYHRIKTILVCAEELTGDMGILFVSVAVDLLPSVADDAEIVDALREDVVNACLKRGMDEEMHRVAHSISNDATMTKVLIRVAAGARKEGNKTVAEQMVENLATEEARIQGYIALMKSVEKMGVSRADYKKKAEILCDGIADPFLRMRAFNNFALAVDKADRELILEKARAALKKLGDKNKLYSVAAKEFAYTSISLGIMPTDELIQSIGDTALRDGALRHMLRTHSVAGNVLAALKVAERMSTPLTQQEAFLDVVSAHLARGNEDAAVALLSRFEKFSPQYMKAKQNLIDYYISKGLVNKALEMADSPKPEAGESSASLRELECNLARIKRMCRTEGYTSMEELQRLAKKTDAPQALLSSVKELYEKASIRDESKLSPQQEKQKSERIKNLETELLHIFSLLSREGGQYSIDITEGAMNIARHCASIGYNPNEFLYEKAGGFYPLTTMIEKIRRYAYAFFDPNAVAIAEVTQYGKKNGVLTLSIPQGRNTENPNLDQLNGNGERETLAILARSEKHKEQIIAFAKERSPELLVTIAFDQFQKGDSGYRELFTFLQNKFQDFGFEQKLLITRMRAQARLDTKDNLELIEQSVYKNDGKVSEDTLKYVVFLQQVGDMKKALAFVATVIQDFRKKEGMLGVFGKKKMLKAIEMSGYDSMKLLMLEKARIENALGVSVADTIDDVRKTIKERSQVLLEFIRAANDVHQLKKEDIDRVKKEIGKGKRAFSEFAAIIPEIIIEIENKLPTVSDETDRYSSKSIKDELQRELGIIYARRGMYDKAMELQGSLKPNIQYLSAIPTEIAKNLLQKGDYDGAHAFLASLPKDDKSAVRNAVAKVVAEADVARAFARFKTV